MPLVFVLLHEVARLPDDVIAQFSDQNDQARRGVVEARCFPHEKHDVHDRMEILYPYFLYDLFGKELDSLPVTDGTNSYWLIPLIIGFFIFFILKTILMLFSIIFL